MGESPLVTIIVVTYNSSKYVIETLESAKVQTYQNIELVITDDCSTDNTVEICKMWLDNNKTHFVKTQLVTTSKNSGISANCNRGMRSANGEWVKMIAGDDIFLDNCIEDNIQFVKNNPETKIIYSKPIRFGGDESSMQISESNYAKNEWIFYESSAVQLQNEMDRIPFWYTVTQFIKKEIWIKFEYDERYPNIEDIPFILKCLKAGYKLDYFPIYTVKYRFGHSDSVQNTGSNKKAYFDLYRQEYFYYDIKNKGVLFAWNNFINFFIRTKKSKNFKLLLLLSPYYIFHFFLRHIQSKKEN